MQSYEKGLSQEGKGSIFGIFFGDLGLFDYFCALKRMEHMRKLIPFLLAGGIVLCAASCKEEKKTEDIITRIPPKKVVKKGTGKMSDFTYEKQVEAFGETLDISIRRYADTTLQQAKDESGRAYYDNKVQLVIKRNDGSVFVDRTFAKTDFSEFTNNDYGRHGALLGFMFDTVENGRLKLGASVGSPDPTSDEFIPIEVLIDRQGKISFQNATSLDSGNGEEKSKAQSELEAAEAEGM